MPSHSPIYDATAKLFAPIAPYVPVTVLRWEPNVTPLSNAYTAGSCIAVYLLIIFSLRAYLRNIKAKRSPSERKEKSVEVVKVKGKKTANGHDEKAVLVKPREKPVIPAAYLKYPFLIHNILLSAGSGLLLALMLEEVYPIWRRNGAFYSICGEGAWTMRLETFYIINYYIKYWELVDTLFLVLKEKPLAFLHVYHHSATALLCFTQLHGKTSVSWVVISLNLAVHVLMYAYYALTSMGIRVPWKKAVTVAQITQFVIDLFVVFFASYTHWAYGKWNMKSYTKGDCAGKEYAAISGMCVLSSYLVLFILFYQKTYLQKKGRQLQDAVTGSKTVKGKSE
ncbi:hypothetical protein CBS101457_003276 [Exobasidium rhododendri]|nr:hypothetical protein CBS101457_003276 [Exobasidium rhododendri]